MAFREYGNYDGVGLADLVRKKQVSAAELLDEAIARTAKVDPKINAVVVKHYDYAKRQIDKGLPDGPFTGVPFLLKDLDLIEGTATTFGASIYKDNVADHTGTLAQRFLDCRRHDVRQERHARIRLAADHRIAGCTARPATPGISRTPPAVRPAARRPRSPRASCRWRMPATAAARSGFRLPPPACSE